ncbi:hypothetical protein, conserved, partial [Eimeria maxima]
MTGEAPEAAAAPPGCSPSVPPISIPPSVSKDAELAAVQIAIEKTTRLLELEKRRLWDLSDASERAQAEYNEKRTRYCFNKAETSKEFYQAEQQIHLLENRVAQATSKHNTELCEIAELRVAIDKHRKDRLSLEQLQLVLTKEAAAQETELHAVKQQIQTLQQEEQQALQDKKQLRKIQDKERTEFKQILQKKQQILKSHEQRLKEMQQQANKDGMRLHGQIRDSGFAVPEEDHRHGSTQKLLKDILKATLLNAAQRRSIKQYKKHIEVFDRAMESIRASTGIS